MSRQKVLHQRQVLPGLLMVQMQPHTQRLSPAQILITTDAASARRNPTDVRSARPMPTKAMQDISGWTIARLPERSPPSDCRQRWHFATAAAAMDRTTAQKLAAVSLFLILFLRISGAVSLGYAMSMGLLSTFPSQGELARYLPFKQWACSLPCLQTLRLLATLIQSELAR